MSGLARVREWDATALVALPELESEPVTTFELLARPGGLHAEPGVPAGVVERVVAALDTSVARPYAARAVRQGRAEWLAGAVEIRSEELELPAPAGTSSIEVVRPPAGRRQVMVDGEEALEPLAASLGAAVEELDRRGSARFESFVARADKVLGDRWDLTIDAL